MVKRLLNDESAAEDLALAVSLAEEKQDQQGPPNWMDVCNLALYYLCAGETQRSIRLYKQVAKDKPPPYVVQEALHDLSENEALLPPEWHAAWQLLSKQV